MCRFQIISVLLFTMLLPALPLAAQEILLRDDFSTWDEWKVASGFWEIPADGQLHQTDEKEKAALITRPVAQNGFVTYTFDITIIGGLEDGYGGFGMHVGVNDPATTQAWGNGESFLLWVTYDEKTYGTESFYGQMYRSRDIGTMPLLHEGPRYPVNLPGFLAGYPEGVIGQTMHVALSLDFATGDGFFLDLSGSGRKLAFHLGSLVPTGAHLSFRTNSARIAIDNLIVTRGR